MVKVINGGGHGYSGYSGGNYGYSNYGPSEYTSSYGKYIPTIACSPWTFVTLINGINSMRTLFISAGSQLNHKSK